MSSEWDEDQDFDLDLHGDNDGLIKRHVGKKLWANLQRSAPNLAPHFERVCDSKDMEPWQVLGDHVIKALDSEAHSEMLFSVDIDMGKINADQLRIEDAKFVKEMSEELGLERESKEDPIDNLIRDRIEATAQGPFPNIDNMGGGMEHASNGTNEEVKEAINQMSQEIKDLQARMADGDVEVSDSGDNKKDLDDVFGGGGDGEVIEVDGFDEVDGNASETVDDDEESEVREIDVDGLNADIGGQEEVEEEETVEEIDEGIEEEGPEEQIGVIGSDEGGDEVDDE